MFVSFLEKDCYYTQVADANIHLVFLYSTTATSKLMMIIPSCYYSTRIYLVNSALSNRNSNLPSINNDKHIHLNIYSYFTIMYLNLLLGILFSTNVTNALFIYFMTNLLGLHRDFTCHLANYTVNS